MEKQNPLADLSITARYEIVIERIQENAWRSGRKPEDIHLLVVTKGQSIDRIKEVVRAGSRLLGENYLQEALRKQVELGSVNGLEWHMIGHVQSRKAQQVCQNFSCVQSVDRMKLAEKLSYYCKEAEIFLPVLLECNISGEESKYGWLAWNEDRWDELIQPFSYIGNLSNITVKGLMTMPPYFNNPEQSRPYFKKIKRLQEFLLNWVPEVGWDDLSIGMSGDYEVAIQEGATILRIGTAIMGERKG